ncbi:MAG: hypothetical protein QOE66_434 [Chloroflexota bacterium]|nr:hypothetical protein [Chloroflexota bacterium]
MADAESRMDDAPPTAGRVPAVAEPPLAAYRAALARYGPDRLRAIAAGLGVAESGARGPAALAGQIAEYLEGPRAIESVLGRLEHGARLALGLFALTEAASWPWAGLAQALECLGAEPLATVRGMVDLGVLAVAAEQAGDREPMIGFDPLSRLDRDPAGLTLHAHPAALASWSTRTVLPAGARPAVAGPVRMVREADGLEPVLRLAALWQRVVEEPLRQTQQGTLYKRDRERLEDDPVLAGPIADALEPLPDMAALWLALAREVELVVPHPGSDRDVAARPEFWADQAIHLPRMIALRWLGLRHWHEQGGMRQEGSTVELALPYLRPAVLLWLATLGPDDWVALDDLAAHLRGLAPRWDRATLVDEPPAPSPSPVSSPGVRSRSARGSKPDAGATPAGLGPGVLESLLLGAAYQFGLVRVAEEVDGGRRVVQITPLGRYVLALGDPPPPRMAFEHFLFVQPNFEIIAYRQGLTLQLIGEFSRFAQWSQVGAAVEMRLTAESIYRGLEGGLTERAILDRLARHSPRALPAGVAEALRTWAGRRERVIYHAAATLIEFATREDLERGLKDWPAEGPPPVRISDRLLLVEDNGAAPMGRFRITGSRNYRRAPEACLEAGPDGVSLTLDLARSDLLVDAELARFADEQASEPSHDPPGNPRRRFLVSHASLSRATENGLSPALLAHWYLKRTGHEMPAAVRLLLLAATARTPVLATSRPLILQAPSAQWLDGLLQHPATRDYLGERLGPTAVIIPDSLLEPFRRALEGLGLSLDSHRPH